MSLIYLKKLTGKAMAGLLAVLCFAAGLAAVLITERRLQK